MKTYIPYSLILAAAASGLAYGAETAYTTPVGYFSVTTPANSDSTFSASLNRAPELQTIATAASGATLTIQATGIAANAYAYSAGVQPKTYYVKFLTGALAGQYHTINSNTASTAGLVELTLESGVTITGTPSVAIGPHWTLGTAFPGGAGVGSTTDPAEPTSFLLRQDQVGVGLNRAPNKLYFYFNDVDGGGAASGWYDNDDLGAGVQNDTILYPDELYIIRNNTIAGVTATLSGEVPKAGPATALVRAAQANDNFVSAPLPIDITLVESGLLQSGAYTPTTDPAEPIDFVLVYDDAAGGINKGPTKVYFYFNDVDGAGAASGWYDNDDLGAGTVDAQKIIKGGRGFVVRKGSGAPGSIPWTSTIPYTL